MNPKIWAFFVVCVCIVFVGGCGGGGGGGGGGAPAPAATTGTLTVGLTDASTAGYQAIYVTVAQVAVHRDGGSEWDVVSTPGKTYNLLDLVNGVREELALATLTSGHYTQMRLLLSDTPDDSLNILSRRHPYANYFIDDAGQSIELKVPSGFQTGIKIVQGFDINANQTTELLLDFDAQKSIVRAGNSGKWLLKPTIRMLDTAEYAIIEGRVTDTGGAGLPGVLFSAQVYDGSAPALEDRVRIEAATLTDASGNYKLFLEPGTYTLVGYKDGYAAAFKSEKVVVAARTVYSESFALTTSATGTLTGDVVIAGADSEQYATISIRKSVTVSGNSEQIEIKSLNVANGGAFTTVLPVGSYTVVLSTFGKTSVAVTVTIASGGTTDIGVVTF